MAKNKAGLTVATCVFAAFCFNATHSTKRLDYASGILLIALLNFQGNVAK